MKRRLEAFKAEHVDGLTAQSYQVAEKDYVVDWTSERWRQLEGMPYAKSGLNCQRTLFCCGLVPKWPGRAVAWILIDQLVGPADMLWIHRHILKLLDSAQRKPEYRRIEATVLDEFDAAHHWMSMLGFEPEGRMRKYDPNGHDHWLYARIR